MKKFPLIFLLTTLVLMSGCKPGTPNGVLSERKMEDILYDYHIAQGMADYQEGKYDTLLARVYEAAVLKKHSTTKAEFDSSMVYYMWHTDRMHKIYESLSKRIEAEMRAMGGTGGGAGEFAAFGTTGDTANVWNGPRAVVLSHHPAFNHYSFALKTDTTFHSGDKLLLSFNTEFIYQDGMRDGVVLMAVRFGNDSVATRILHATSTNHYNLELTDDKRLGIKNIKGYFLINGAVGRSERHTTMKLVVFKDIALVRMRNNMPVSQVQPVDSLNRKEDADSAVNGKNERQLGNRPFSHEELPRLEDRIVRRDNMPEQNRNNNKNRQ